MEISGRTLLSGILDRKYVVRMAVHFAAVRRAYSDFQHFVAFETKLNIDDRRFIMVVQKRSAIPTFFLKPFITQFLIPEHYYAKRYNWRRPARWLTDRFKKPWWYIRLTKPKLV